MRQALKPPKKKKKLKTGLSWCRLSRGPLIEGTCGRKYERVFLFILEMCFSFGLRKLLKVSMCVCTGFVEPVRKSR